ncbi:TetR/AcrR family transcriptional regulator [Brevibacillus choshinensis]|uniref:TetR/AcrR family transcriptional regulator n=1 Tax=Brevibacillus choshinensis TaxID=54911 RepID=UPI000A91DAE7
MTKITEHIDGRNLRSINTRKRLLAAGHDIFIEYGFQKATISQIIKKAKTGYGTAYVHFSGKDDLLIVLMEDVMNRFYEIAKMSFEPTSKQEAIDMITMQTRLFLENAINEQAIMQVFVEAIRHSDKVQEKWSEIRESFVEQIAKDVAYAQTNGLARTDLDNYLVARNWFSLNETHLWDIVNHTHKHTVSEIVHNITALYTGGLYY